MTIYAVNGKEPIAAWIPSLDTAGNGTTTLTDLVGSNNGTLTNMDAATDWVADTDTGGVRALDFDGVNDYVEVPADTAIDNLANADCGFSFWFRFASLTLPTVARRLASKRDLSGGTRGWIAARNTSNGLDFVVVNSGGIAITNSSVSISDTNWHHAVFVWSSSSGSSNIYLDNVSVGVVSSAFTGDATDSSNSLKIGVAYLFAANTWWDGLIDDFRIFDQALDATDIAYLYNSGNGRGITATTPNTRRRRYTGGYGL